MPLPDPARVQALIMDVDGVLTDGTLIIDDAGREARSFHIRDGVALVAWQRLGFVAAAISGRGGASARYRLEELGVRHVIQQADDKTAALRHLLNGLGVECDAAAYVGDDWPDLPAMRLVGYPVAVADAHPDVRAVAVYVTAAPGGRGAVREVVEHLLGARGLLDQARRLYDRHHEP